MSKQTTRYAPTGRSRRRWGTLTAATALAASGLAAGSAAGASTGTTEPGGEPAATEADGTEASRHDGPAVHCLAPASTSRSSRA